MLVNGTDISVFHSTLLTKDIQTAEVTIFDDWLRQSPSPLYLGKQEKFKTIKLQFLIEDTSDYNCLVDIGNLIAQLEKCTLKFDDLAFYYDATIVNNDQANLIQDGSYIAENPDNFAYTQDVELKSPYAYLPTTSIAMPGTSQIITVSGNRQTAAIVTLTPTIDMGSVTLTGFGKAITVKNLHKNIAVIIDGEQGLITENGINKFADADMWDFPTLNPGANTINLSIPGAPLNIQYKPKFI